MIRSGLLAIALAFAVSTCAGAMLFPTGLTHNDWNTFRAEGFSKPACGVVYHLRDKVTNGMALGGIDTGCIDLDTNGLLGYCTIFNTAMPRRGPINLPVLGLSVGGQTWVMCDKSPKQGDGQYQVGPIRNQVLPVLSELKLDGVETATDISYWGHYPVADMEFETTAPISVGLRAWSPFFPGDEAGSTLPGIVFEVHLRNTGISRRQGTIAFSFPGPDPKEAGTERFARTELSDGLSGVQVDSKQATYILGTIGNDDARFGGELGADGAAWANIAKALPQPASNQPGSSSAVDFSLAPGKEKVVRFILTWYSPTWKGGGYNWSDKGNTFTHMYAKYYPSATEAAKALARDHKRLLKRVLAWQQVIYTDKTLPVWLRDSLVNSLYMITEDGMWAQAKSPIPEWVRPDDGLFGMNECPRGCPQIECIPCSFYGNLPLVYLFPKLALSTLRGYKGYQDEKGDVPWTFSGLGTIDFAQHNHGYQTTLNGLCYADMVDRYAMCWGDKDFLSEFYGSVKANAEFTVNLRPEYGIGDRIISMPSRNIFVNSLSAHWFEAPEPGWFGMVPHVGGLHLAQLEIAKRMAEQTGDKAFVKQCDDWIAAGRRSLEEKTWNGSYYLTFLEPESGKKSDFVFGYQLDGEWVADFHGLPGVFRKDRIDTTLQTIKRCNIALSKTGAVNYAHSDGTPAIVGGYGTYSYFPPEALMLAMNYMYEGQRDFGVELARRVWHNIICVQGLTWDMPNIMRGDKDTSERSYGNDYYQDMIIWSLPAAMEGKDLGAPAKPGGLIDRILRAAREKRP